MAKNFFLQRCVSNLYSIKSIDTIFHTRTVFDAKLIENSLLNNTDKLSCLQRILNTKLSFYVLHRLLNTNLSYLPSSILQSPYIIIHFN